MFEWLLPEKHAVAVLKKDHDHIKSLFEEFEKAKTTVAKEKIIEEALTELKIHAVLEEEMFYPAVRSHVGSKLMNEADEEHHVAKVLIAELDAKVGDKDHRDAKFMVLAENVRHHIGEEEREMLPKAREVHLDFSALGQKMLDRKQQLLTKGVAPDAEHTMVAKSKGKGDSPAKAAKTTKTRKPSIKTSRAAH